MFNLIYTIKSLFDKKETRAISHPKAPEKLEAQERCESNELTTVRDNTQKTKKEELIQKAKNLKALNMSNKNIGIELSISPNTVAKYLKL